MQKVVTVSLNGNAYQLDEDAYAQLAGYLEQSARALAGNPDLAEIVADLEQAIGEKCARCLNAHKTVVTGPELAQIIAEMGPVDPGLAEPSAGPGSDPQRDAPAATPRRLYQISEGALVSGVCNGIAAYLNIDVTLVRMVFVALTLLTGGIALLGYVVLMFIIPYASTSEEHAAARGLPFNARVLVERAKQKYAQFTHGADPGAPHARWREEWRRTRAYWRAERRRAREQWRTYRRSERAPLAPPIAYVTYVLTGALLAVFGLVFAALTILWLLAMLSLITTGALFGWMLPLQIPFWVALIALIVLYQFVAWPFKAMRHAYFSMPGQDGSWIAAWNGIISLAIVAVLIWFAYTHGAELRDFPHRFGQWWHGTGLAPGGQST
jgi:phage shock protein PspC (stress-responsive transcriptional regulator)